MKDVTGGCACGAIRYAIGGRPIGGGFCHCRDCQYASGGSPAAVIAFPRKDYRLTKGDPRVYWSTSDRGVRVARLFCGACGTRISALNENNTEMIPISVGSLDDPSWFRPAAHIWTSSAQPWHHIDRTIACFEADPI